MTLKGQAARGQACDAPASAAVDAGGVDKSTTVVVDR
jgi:hypothetical protein